jgi:hypothetical protein
MLFPDKSTIILLYICKNGALFLSFAGMIWVLALDRVSRDVDIGQIIFDLDISCLVTRLSVFLLLRNFRLHKLIVDAVLYHSKLLKF